MTSAGTGNHGNYETTRAAAEPFGCRVANLVEFPLIPLRWATCLEIKFLIRVDGKNLANYQIIEEEELINFS